METEIPTFKHWCVVELLGHVKIAGLVTEFEQAIKETTGEISNDWGVTERVKKQARLLQEQGFTLADLREFDAGRTKTPQLNFLARDMVGWRKDQSRAPDTNRRLTQAEINQGGKGKLVL